MYLFFFSSRRRHTRLVSDWSSDVCTSDLGGALRPSEQGHQCRRRCDEKDDPGGGLEAGLDDTADRLERHASAPAAASSRASVSIVATGKVHGVSGDRQWRSWPGVLWWRSDGRDASARRATRL